MPDSNPDAMRAYGLPLRALSLLVALLLVPTAAAHGEGAATVRAVLSKDVAFGEKAWPNGRSLLTLPNLVVRPGEAWIVRGVLVARSAVARATGQQAGIACDGFGGGEQVGGSIRTIENHRGRTFLYDAGRGLLRLEVVKVVESLDTDHLSNWPPASIAECSLWAQALGEGLVAVAGKTFMEATPAPAHVAAQWGDANRCSSHGSESTCAYAIPRAVSQTGRRYPATVTTLLRDSEPTGSPAARVVADPTAGRIAFEAGLEVTTCYRNTASCRNEVDRYGRYRDAVVETKVVVQAATNEPCGTIQSRAKRTRVFDAAHHAKIVHVFEVDPQDLCGPQLSAWLVVTAISGNPIKLEPGPESDDNALPRNYDYSTMLVRPA